GHKTSATSAKASFGRAASMTLCAPESFAPAPSGAITHDAPHARAASKNFSSSTNTTSPSPAASIEATPRTIAPAPPDARPSLSALQGGARLGGEAAAPQPYRVQPAHARRVAVGQEERQNVLHDLGLATDHRVAPEAHELVRAHVRRQEGVILDGNMSRERDA